MMTSLTIHALMEIITDLIERGETFYEYIDEYGKSQKLSYIEILEELEDELEYNDGGFN